MQFKVWTEKSDKPKTIYLKLQENERGEIELITIDEYNISVIAGYILRITENGIYRYQCLSPDIGFQLDSQSRIRLDE